MPIRNARRPDYNRINRLAQPRRRRGKAQPAARGRVCAIGKPPRPGFRNRLPEINRAAPVGNRRPNHNIRHHHQPPALAPKPVAPKAPTASPRASRIKLPEIQKPRSPREYRLRSGNKLGQGAFGAVYRVESPRTKRELAIKQVKFKDGGLSLAQQRSIKKEALKEARLLKSLNHPNIVKQEHCKLYPKDLRIVMELIDGQDFEKHIRKNGTLPEREAKTVFKKIVSAMAYSHSEGIVHRDLKPANIMRTRSGDVKVVDFGVGRKVPTSNLARTRIGTPLYVAPEKNGSAYDAKAADVWEAGMTLLFLLVNPPADRWAKDRVAVMWQDPKVRALSSDCKSLLRKMLSTSPRRRPTMEQVLKHPWLVGA